MIRRTTLLIMAALALALTAPAAAWADPVGDPIATSYVARIAHTPPGVQARIIDGYLQLWMSVRPSLTVTVLDQVGAPWLRFDPQGVSVNENSLQYAISQVPVAAIPVAHINAHVPPHWVRVSSGHTWMWSDGRLGAFASQALSPRSTYAGPWSIPLRIDGTTARLSGSLFFRPQPSPVWFWPVAVILACVLAAWRIRRTAVDRRLVLGLTELLLGALLIVAVARLLHGRPTVSPVQIIELGFATAAILTGAVLLARGRFPAALPFIVAAVALWAGLTFLPILTNANALVILPPWLSRAATVVLLGGGLGLVPVAMRRPLLAAPRSPQVAELSAPPEVD